MGRSCGSVPNFSTGPPTLAPTTITSSGSTVPEPRTVTATGPRFSTAVFRDVRGGPLSFSPHRPGPAGSRHAARVKASSCLMGTPHGATGQETTAGRSLLRPCRRGFAEVAVEPVADGGHVEEHRRPAVAGALFAHQLRRD